MTDKTPAPQVWPTLRAKDARALIDFLVEGFGFEITMISEHDGIIAHAQLAWPEGGGIMLGQSRPAGADDPWALVPGTFGGYVVTDDPDAVFARATARGAEVIAKPADTDYGSRDCTVRDPEGNLWNFGTYRGEPRG
jgi:uncharacterized glyoxalase superfamily protein PhnB